MKKKCEELLGKEVKITLNNGINFYGILDCFIPSSKSAILTDEIYIKSKGNIMGFVIDNIKTIVENI